jgi:F-type H+-transporting ATPase subunit epsilon
MNLEILTPEKTVFSDDIFGVLLPGAAGQFEVLENHAPMISALKAGKIKILKDIKNPLAFFDIQSGFVEILANTVTVLVEGAQPVEA